VRSFPLFVLFRVAVPAVTILSIHNVPPSVSPDGLPLQSTYMSERLRALQRVLSNWISTLDPLAQSSQGITNRIADVRAGDEHLSF
jgi:hypothetical protein